MLIGADRPHNVVIVVVVVVVVVVVLNAGGCCFESRLKTVFKNECKSSWKNVVKNQPSPH